jgi:hypothetical protein
VTAEINALLPNSFNAQSFAKPDSKYAQYRTKPTDATMLGDSIAEMAAGRDDIVAA